METDLIKRNSIGKLLRAEEVAEILSVSPSYVYKLMREGTIPSIPIGRAVRVRERDLMEFIDERAQNNRV